MSNYESRLTALNLAREIAAPGTSAEDLINSASKIEQHLLGLASPEGRGSRVDFKHGIDFHGKPVEHSDPTVGRTWNGTAQDLAILCNSDSTLICKARQVGMTTFLCEYAAEQTKMGKKVLFFSPRRANAEESKRLVLEFGGNTALLDVTAINRFSDPEFPLSFRGRKVDLVIVDGLAFLPYAKEIEFLAAITPMAERFIFASEPAQAQGLFYDLWQNSTSFQKVLLTWNTPLFPLTEERHRRLENLKVNISDDRFRNEFQCEFRTPNE